MNGTKLAKGVFIGDNTLIGYIELVKNSKLGGGLFRKTSDMGIRAENTKANFPRTTSYYYIQQQLRNTPMESKRYFYGDLVSGYNIDGLDIGWAYTTDINEQGFKSRGQASVADFDNLQKLLRNEAIGRGGVGASGQNIDVKTRYKEYKDKGYELGNLNIKKYDDNNGDLGILPIKIGEKYHVKNSISVRKTHNVLRDYANIYVPKQFEELKKNKYNEYGLTIDDKTKIEYYNIDGNNKAKDRNVSFTESDRTDGKEYKDFENGSGDAITGTSATLIDKTNSLFKNHKISTLVNRFQTSGTSEDKIITRGRKLKAKKTDSYGGYSTDYCRVWTANHQYSSMKDVMKPFVDNNGNVVGLREVQKKLSESMRPNGGATRLADNTVLQDNGFVRINPSREKEGGPKNNQKYMFSIENLAWKDKSHILSKEQIGPNKGRIMWFPPYNLKFSENVNVSWNANSFIGRGEQIYTYTNTDRSGTLDFTLLIDHPSLLNEWLGTGDSKISDSDKEELLRFFAGEQLLERDASVKSGKILKDVVSAPAKVEPKMTEIGIEKKVAYVVFFPTFYTGFDCFPYNIEGGLKKLSEYENSSDGKTTIIRDNIPSDNISDKNVFALNTSEGIRQFEDKIKNMLGLHDEKVELKSLIGDIVTPGDADEIIIGKAEKNGDVLFGIKNGYVKKVEYIPFGNCQDLELIDNELFDAETMGFWRLSFMKEIIDKGKFIPSEAEVCDSPLKMISLTTKDNNCLDAKLARMVVAILTVVGPDKLRPTNQTTNSNSTSVNGANISTDKQDEIIPVKTATKTRIEASNKYSSYDNEYLYFTELNRNSEFKNKILTRVKHFNPAFHSLTPEGFNARLTFLHQCTRQGPTAEIGSGNSQGTVSDKEQNYVKYAGNLSFGRAPYCILRIGDFFNTKICIDSISINYDNGGGPQWDLNPEGAGVQPMFANVSINFKFIGGQDIAGPVAKLQNAVSSNYYANASVYDYNAEIGKNEK